MRDRDGLRRFLFERYPIRGHLVRVDAAWRALIEHRDYPVPVRDALGEAVAATLLLAGTIKFDGVLSLQLQGDGPMPLLLAQCTSGFGVRGLARFEEALGGDAIGGDARRADPGTAPRLDALVGAGHLTVTLESEDQSRRYQGVVPIGGARLADSLQGYFENSEQLPTRLWLFADENGASGMLLQKLPGSPGVEPGEADDLEDAWRRAQLLGDTLTHAEMRSLADREILRRLFHEDDLRLFDAAPVYFRCRCSRGRVGNMLHALGEEETRAVLAERGEVEVRCDFCNRAYRFDAVDVAEIFRGTSAGGVSVH
ncbi:MAG: Hsp33 family molecular chaperone HslO [Gammaproteobacteria bacterium]|nr:Hsp33 family molecular chaperone HslO [Gammaproteobacteria bacterium]